MIDKLHCCQESREVTKMTATSTTPSNDSTEPTPVSTLGSEGDSDLKKKRKKKVFIGKEKEEKLGNVSSVV